MAIVWGVGAGDLVYRAEALTAARVLLSGLNKRSPMASALTDAIVSLMSQLLIVIVGAILHLLYHGYKRPGFMKKRANGRAQ